MLVIKKLGNEKASKIEWKNPRVICIAESYNPYDIFALNEITAKLELYSYHAYENNTFTLENVKGDEEKPRATIGESNGVTEIIDSAKKIDDVFLDKHLSKVDPFIQELFFTIKGKIYELDENIQEKINNNYIGFRLSKMFAEVHVQKNRLMLYLRPIDYKNDPENKIFKVPDSYNWVLNRRAYVNDMGDIDYVMNLVEQSYKDVL